MSGAEQDVLAPSDAMTVQAVSAECVALRALLGTATAEVSAHIGISPYGTRNAVYLSLYPSGITRSADGKHFEADAWPEAFRLAREWASTQGVVTREAAIRRMALQIIDLTDQHGRCTAAMLKRQEFSEAQIAELHQVACERAGEMASGAPFSVEMGEAA